MFDVMVLVSHVFENHPLRISYYFLEIDTIDLKTRNKEGKHKEGIIPNVNALFLTYPLNGLLMIALPIALAVFLRRKYHLSWRLWWLGGITFVISQIVHIPFNLLWLNPSLNRLGDTTLPEPVPLILTALALGLSAGLFEEISRYVMYRWWAKDARSWAKGLLTGAGHGGIEAIILGILVLLTFLQLLAIRNTNLSTLVPPEQLELAIAQVNAYWSADWSMTLLGAVERLFAIIFHLSASVLVLQVFIRKQIRWLVLAIVWHALLDASAVVAAHYLNFYQIELVIGIFAFFSLGILIRLHQPEPAEIIELGSTPLPPPVTPVILHPIEENEVNLEQSRYDSH